MWKVWGGLGINDQSDIVRGRCDIVGSLMTRITMSGQFKESIFEL